MLAYFRAQRNRAYFRVGNPKTKAKVQPVSAKISQTSHRAWRAQNTLLAQCCLNQQTLHQVHIAAIAYRNRHRLPDLRIRQRTVFHTLIYQHVVGQNGFHTSQITKNGIARRNIGYRASKAIYLDVVTNTHTALCQHHKATDIV